MISIAYARGMEDADERWEPLESLGPTGATVARNIKRLRKARGLAYTDLSARLAGLNRRIPTLGLRKIESGGRRVDADDLVALAVALGVSPITMLIDPVENNFDAVGVTGYPGGLVRADLFWRWLVAEDTLPQSPEMISAAGGRLTRMMFSANAWPAWLQESEQQRNHGELSRETESGVQGIGDDQ